MWLGKSYYFDVPSPPDVFMQFSVAGISNNTVIVFGNDTLTWSSQENAFYRNLDPTSTSINEELLSYNTTNDSMTYFAQGNSSSGGAKLSLYAGWYIPNPMLKNYLSDIVGTKVFTGTGDNWFVIRQPQDSTYTVTATFTFSAVNDSTITFDNDFLNIGDGTLHYKSTDAVAKTVTFQNFHTYYYRLSTLTYNYETKQLIFDQHYVDIGIHNEVVFK